MDTLMIIGAALWQMTYGFLAPTLVVTVVILRITKRWSR